MASKDIWRFFHRTSLLFGARPCGSCSRLRLTPVMCCQSHCTVHPGKRPPSRWRSYRDLHPAVSFCQFHTSLRHNTHMDTNKYNLDNDCFRKYLEHLKAEYDSECAQIAGNELTVTERHVHLGGVVRKIDALYEKAAEKEDVSKLIAGLTEDDVEMKRLAKEEYEKCQKQMVELEQELVELVTPVISGDDTDVILEVTPGVGGQEAMLFAGEMFTMYQNYATTKGWDFQMVGVDRNEFGGVRRAAASISGEGVYGWLRFEGGVHRVQRVPQTEKSGRVHTSTVTVAILPQPTEIDITLNPKDLQVETCRASGKGGQHVNTTDSAVRIVHTPTGMFAECQTERSQIKNKETAMKVLKSRLYEKSLSEQTSRQQQARKFQVGTAGRSEKIRTYNFNQDRVTDHRLNHSLHNIERVMMGGVELNALIQRLNHEARLELLEEKLSEVSSL